MRQMLNRYGLSVMSRNVHFVVCAVLTTLLMANPQVARAGGDIIWSNIDEPSLRSALFYSYKGQHFEAIKYLQSEQKQGRIKQQEKGGLVLGGLYLAYGFHQEAEKIFEAFLERDQPQPVRDQAWFYLAKTQYQRGRYTQALRALARVQGDLGIVLQPEKVSLEASILMRMEKYDDALKVLPAVGSQSSWWPYARYNMGVSLYRLGRKDQGISVLNELGITKKGDAEFQSVIGQANLTLGYGFLSDNQPDRAKQVFKRMLLDGRHTNRALLGLGRAYSAKNEHEKSLIPWMRLTKQHPSDPSTQDAFMAVPFAFGQLEAFTQALEHYEKAMLTFQDEIKKINAAADAVGGGRLIEGMLRAESGESVGGIWNLKKVLDSPEGRYLWPLLASQEFTETFFNYKQLRLSLGKLEGWSADLNNYESMNKGARQIYRDRMSKLQSRVLLVSEKLNYHLRSMAYDELESRKKRLVGHFNDARFAVAQIYDYAAKRWGQGE